MWWLLTIFFALCALPTFVRPLRCVFFGHRPAFGYGHSEGSGYFQIKIGETDGIGRVHARLYCDCERCDENFQVGKIHLPYEYVQAMFEKELRERPFHLQKQ